jgi:integrase
MDPEVVAIAAWIPGRPDRTSHCKSLQPNPTQKRPEDVMKKGRNTNHPAKGSNTKVEPIKSLSDIRTIKKLLADNPRNLALFTLGINTNLRASDLVRITVGQVRGLKPMDEIEIRETKTKKPRRISINAACVEVIAAAINDAGDPDDDDPLFKGQRGAGLTVPSVINLVKGWCKKINLQSNFGSHTLRKTFGYQQRVAFGVGLPELMVAFNHSSQRKTLDYLCIQPDEVKNIYSNEI